MISEQDRQLIFQAAQRAGNQLGLWPHEVAKITGTAETGTQKAKSDDFEASGTSYRRALLLIRILNSLAAITSGDTKTIRSWMRNRNEDLSGAPAEIMKSERGLDEVVAYLDAVRYRT